jgi:hypothetical protein
MNITVVDLDSVCYRSAAASETSNILVTHLTTGKTKEFKNRTEFKNMLKTKPKFKLEDYNIEDQYVAEPIENCLHTVKRQIEKIKENTAADQLVCVVGGKDNFRDKLPLPKQYKGNRIDMHRPIHLSKAKEYVINKFNAEEINGEESDDAVIYKAYELMKAGHTVIVVTNDKDSLQAEGLLLYDFSKEELIKTEGHWFDIKSRDSGTKKATGSGVGFLAYQLCCGDSTDFYVPTDLCKAKYGTSQSKSVSYGQMSFYKDTRHCKSPEDFLEVVIKKYKEWYPSAVTYKAWDGTEYTKDWKDILDMYVKAAYMKRSRDDKSCSKEFFSKYGVNLDDY